MSKLESFIKEEGLYGLTPRTRCIGCDCTVAQIFKEFGKHALLDGQLLDKSDDSITAIEKEGWICHPCLELDEVEPAATIVLHSEGQKFVFAIGKYAIFERGEDEIDGSLFEQIRAFAKKLTWHSTDAWRGYYTADFDTNWVRVIDDWYGTIDGHNCDRGDFGRFYTKYEIEKTVPDCQLLVCHCRTSNVCSCGIEVYVPKTNLDTFKEWLGIEGLEEE